MYELRILCDGIKIECRARIPHAMLKFRRFYGRLMRRCDRKHSKYDIESSTQIDKYRENTVKQFNEIKPRLRCVRLFYDLHYQLSRLLCPLRTAHEIYWRFDQCDCETGMLWLANVILRSIYGYYIFRECFYAPPRLVGRNFIAMPSFSHNIKFESQYKRTESMETNCRNVDFFISTFMRAYTFPFLSADHVGRGLWRFLLYFDFLKLSIRAWASSIK